jgi:hypothetical protein
VAMFYPAVGEMQGEYSWGEDQEAGELADVLRSTMREEYADASDEEIGDALESILDSMTPAEAFNFGSTLNQIGKSASRLASDPAFVQVVRTAAPIASGAAGTAIGGPLGTALGSRLGTLAASTLPAPTAAVPAAALAPGAAAMPTPAMPPAPNSASPVAEGSAAAAQALVLCQHGDVLRGLLAAADPLARAGQLRSGPGLWAGVPPRPRIPEHPPA